MSVWGQESSSESVDEFNIWIADANIAIVDPINNFGEEVVGGKVGFSISVLRQVKPESSMFIGLGSYYARIARDLQENVTTEGDAVDDIANSNMLGFDILFRYYPNVYIWQFEPYIEGTIGYRTFYTVTKSFFPDFNETSNYQTNEFNGALSYGFGLGTHIYVDTKWSINLKFNFQVANIANYYIEREVKNSLDPLENMSLENSQTDLLRFDIGISYLY